MNSEAPKEWSHDWDTLLWVWTEFLIIVAAMTIGIVAWRFNGILAHDSRSFGATFRCGPFW
jgi:hypothetical protein